MQFEKESTDFKFRLNWGNYKLEKKEFDEDWVKCYALIFGTYCTGSTRNAVKELPSFESTIIHDPLELLTQVSILMHIPVRACYSLLLSLAENRSSLLNLRKIDDEKLLDYHERFSQEQNQAKSQLGMHILDTFLENTM